VTAQAVLRIQEAASTLAERIIRGEVGTRDALEKAKRTVAKAYSLDRYVTNAEILAVLPLNSRASFQEMLRVHPRRSGSGIVVVTAFSAPFACPHGTCVFCPGGPKDGTPQSYLPASPGMRTAIASEFDPFKQVRESLRKYCENGHDTSKAEAIIEGGTFIAVPLDYQRSFVKGVYDGLNGYESTTLESAQHANETAVSRCVGLTLESKPDWCGPQEIDLMLEYGITRLEIGVQSLNDAVLRKSNRGHTVADTVEAFRTARDAGLKVTAHMMPGLPGANPEDDLRDLKSLFENESFRPDMMKLYPTLVVGGTSLERQFSAGLYEPYGTETVVELLSEMKRFVPSWHRIMRIQREIPAYEISAGVKNGNLRELVLARAKEKGFSCRCIRCREVGLDSPSEFEGEDELNLKTVRYAASMGTEIFASYESKKSGRIAGFVRMRLPSEEAHRPEMRDSAVVRELRVYGKVVGVGSRAAGAWQHSGLGASMMEEMEKTAKEEFGVARLLVTSAVGTRNYYRKLGYERLGPYMAKSLRPDGES
jgi:elongator complex protein 3